MFNTSETASKGIAMEKTPYNVFLEQLRAVRIARKLTQEQLASSIKLSRAQYTAIENGRSLINFQHLHNLAIVLNVRFVIGDEESPLATKVMS
jgi:transcriptional regulator with XRE-family HTH domain